MGEYIAFKGKLISTENIRIVRQLKSLLGEFQIVYKDGFHVEFVLPQEDVDFLLQGFAKLLQPTYWTKE